MSPDFQLSGSATFVGPGNVKPKHKKQKAKKVKKKHKAKKHKKKGKKKHKRANAKGRSYSAVPMSLRSVLWMPLFNMVPPHGDGGQTRLHY